MPSNDLFIKVIFHNEDISVRGFITRIHGIVTFNDSNTPAGSKLNYKIILKLVNILMLKHQIQLLFLIYVNVLLNEIFEIHDQVELY